MDAFFLSEIFEFFLTFWTIAIVIIVNIPYKERVMPMIHYT